MGCFSGSSETLSQYINNGTYQFQSVGYCQFVCDQSGYNFFALEGGEDCRCGSDLPPITDLIDGNNCNIPCVGFALRTCTLLSPLYAFLILSGWSGIFHAKNMFFSPRLYAVFFLFLRH